MIRSDTARDSVTVEDITLMKRSCASGYGEACYRLSEIDLPGNSGVQSVNYLLEGCSIGHSASCRQLEELYWAHAERENRKGFKQEMCGLSDEGKKDCEAFAESGPRLGELDRYPGIPRQEFLRALQISCESGIATSCRQVADIVTHSRGRKDLNHIESKPDYVLGKEYYDRACVLWDDYSCSIRLPSTPE